MSESSWTQTSFTSEKLNVSWSGKLRPSKPKGVSLWLSIWKVMSPPRQPREKHNGECITFPQFCEERGQSLWKNCMIL